MMMASGVLVVAAVVVVLAALAGFIATRPSAFRIERSRTLAAPPAVVHAYVNDFHKWPQWSPWEKLDPSMKKDWSGPPAGVGASYHWVGNSKAGEGRMTITDSRAPQTITMRLEFIKPWTATNTAQFDLTPSGSGTHVGWAMTGQSGFAAKAFGLFMNMDKLVGRDFEQGLANLDTVTAAAKTA